MIFKPKVKYFLLDRGLDFNYGGCLFCKSLAKETLTMPKLKGGLTSGYVDQLEITLVYKSYSYLIKWVS